MKITGLCLILVTLGANAQKATISGTITEDGSGENLIGANVFELNSSQGTTSNTYGFYSLTLPKDSVYLRISYVGYQSNIFKLKLRADTTVNISLRENGLLQEIVFSAESEDEIQNSTRMGTIEVPVDHIKALPALMGEVDLMKVLQLLPGVQSGTEGGSGLYVRGGGPEQNLILLDGVPVYNASHLFGFFSVFNADAINHVELIKGGFPARYGGRLSSVIDIRMKEGNKEKIQGEGAIGLIASRVTVEGPLKKNKSSFIVSGRRTYVDLLARPILKNATKGEETAGYFFYDLNAKINYVLGSKNKIYLSTYMGDDKAYARSRYSSGDQDKRLKNDDQFGLKWGNITSAIRWNSILSSKLFSNVTATYSRYRFGVSADSEEVYTSPDTSVVSYYHTSYKSGIRDYGMKVDFDYIPSPAHYIRFGAQAVNHLFTPGVLAYKSESVADTTVGAKSLSSREFFAYAEDDILLHPKLKVNVGVHASAFLTGSKQYQSVQPRLSARFLVNEKISLKASYAQMTQYIHLLTNAGIGLPTDLWVPSTPKIKPEQSFITSVGGAWNVKPAYEVSVEAYYKTMNGIIEYKEGASYLDIEQDWQDKVEAGTGRSYGSEFFLQKKKGRVSGWLGYTLSWTDRTFKNINHGKTFPYRYDRRHDVEVTLSYKWKPTKDFSLTWVYGTGAAVSLPQSQYMSYPEYPNAPGEFYSGTYIDYYGGRNAYRMRAYHRLDLGYTSTKKTKWGERSWSISVYNAYNRRNPFFIDVGTDKKGQAKFIQYSLFPTIPSIAYRFKF
jgi:outer membrane receptor for ferrienterochelin and colicin